MSKKFKVGDKVRLMPEKRKEFKILCKKIGVKVRHLI